ncbi:MAG: Tim44/TimA family putative adaptor protein, partial [Stellaceae bacterium]
MDGGYQVIDILLFAGIAGFLVYRLRSVLGRRTGFERRRD